jgi:hypothetical protein
VEEEYV